MWPRLRTLKETKLTYIKLNIQTSCPLVVGHASARTQRVAAHVCAVGCASELLTASGRPPTGLLQSEDGPWQSDTVTLTYQNRLRTGLNLSQPSASGWVQSYTYDAARRLKTLSSPAGAFSYDYDGTAQMVVKKLGVPNGAYITNAYDSTARMLATVLKNNANGMLNSHGYGYNKGNQRTALTNALGDWRDYRYDNIGQVTSGVGHESNGADRVHERNGYAYDAAGNLAYRTNNTWVDIFSANGLNELSSKGQMGYYTVAGTTTSAATNVTVNSSNAIRYADNTFEVNLTRQPRHSPCHENEHWRSFSITNASQKEAKLIYVRLNIPMPCPPRGTVPVHTRARFCECVHLSAPGSLSARDATAPAMSRHFGDRLRFLSSSCEPARAIRLEQKIVIVERRLGAQNLAGGRGGLAGISHGQ